MLCLATAASAQPASGDGTLQAAVNYPAGQFPWSVAVGDFNGDHTEDLAVVNLGSRVSVLLGNGDGSFQPPRSSAAGAYPWSVAAGEFNGDGVDDLVVGSTYDGISVLLGLGDGTFGVPVKWVDGLYPSSAAVDDFNGDGRADLAVVATTFHGVGVLLGNGDGTFQPGVNYEVGPAHPGALVVADFNGDGSADLATTGGYGLNVLLGRGDGTFGEATRIAEISANSVVAGDFDRDGTVDLAGAAQTPRGVHVVLGNGDGTFQPATGYGPDLYPAAFAVTDLNGDGRDDLAVVTYLVNDKTGMLFGGDVSVMLAAEGGSLRPAVHYGAGIQPRALAVGRFDGDDAVDLAVANSSGLDVSVLLNGPVTTTRAMHVGDIDANVKLAPDGTAWHAQIQVRAESGGRAAPAGTLVSGSWEDGTVASCVTTSPGTCVVTRLQIPTGAASATFRVMGLSHAAYPEYGYDPAGNHDPDGDSDGTSIAVVKP